tara:strand:+ start:254 stop:682 length:429 start_codon:yes stop_codon:yes gene_type:complete
MSVLSKPLFFQSCHTNGVSQTYRRVDKINNAHFWIEKNGVIIDPTEAIPYEGGRRIYLPFTNQEQKDLGNQWLADTMEKWDSPADWVISRIHNWRVSFPQGENGKCWFNSIKYQHEHGGNLVCGLMGHYNKDIGCVDVDYGY